MKKILIISLVSVLLSPAAYSQAQTKPAAKPTAKKASVAKKTPAGPVKAPAEKKEEAAPEKTPFDLALDQINSENPNIRRAGADALARTRDGRAPSYLEKLLADPDDSVRIAAIDGLGVLRNETSIDKLLKILAEDKSALVRQSCVIALSYMSAPKNPDVLIYAAMNDKDISVRCMAIRTLGSLKITKAEDELIKALKEDDAGIKRAAISALGAMQSLKAADKLKKYVTDADAGIRQETIKALGGIGDLSAVENIKPRLDENVPAIQLEAALALAKMGDGSGLSNAYEYLDSADSTLQQQSLTVLAMIGDEKSAQTLDKKIKETENESVKPLMEFTRQRILARLKLDKRK